MGNVKLQQGGVYIITTQAGSSLTPRSLSGTEEIFEKTFLEGINNAGSMRIGSVRTLTGGGGLVSIDYTNTNIFVKTDSGTMTLSIPTATGTPGRIINIKKIGGTNTLTLDPVSVGGIDGNASLSTTDASASIQLISSGYNTTGWYILNTYGTWT